MSNVITSDADRQEIARRIDALYNRSTCYELAISKGDERYLVCYCDKSRASMLRNIQDDGRVNLLIAFAGSDEMEFAKKAGDGIKLGDWTIRFTGRTERESILGGELTRFTKATSPVSFPEPTPPADGPAAGTTPDDHPQASPYVEAPDHGPEPTTRDLPEAAPARTPEQVAAGLTNAVLALFEAEPGADTFRRWDLAMTVFSGLAIAEMDALASQLPKHLADDGFVGLAGWASFCQAGNVVRFPESPPISGPTPSRDSIDLGKRPGIWGPDGRGPAARRTQAAHPYGTPLIASEVDQRTTRPATPSEGDDAPLLVEIAGTTYAVTLHPRSVVLTKGTGSGESYEVMIEDPECSCNDYRYRHKDQPNSLGCKHIKAVRRLHLIPTLILETV